MQRKHFQIDARQNNERVKSTRSEESSDQTSFESLQVSQSALNSEESCERLWEDDEYFTIHYVQWTMSVHVQYMQG